MPPKKKKELDRFRPRLQDERRRENRFAAKDTTAESSFTSLLASGASFLGREAAKREVPRERSRAI